MVRIILLLFAMLAALSVKAQDVIVMKDGDEVNAKVLSLNDSDVSYKKWENQEGPTYTTSKSKIFMIKYANGYKEVFKDELAAEQPTQTAAEPAANVSIGLPDEERNKELISQVNAYEPTFKKIKEGKKASYAALQLYATDDSQLANKDIEVSFVTGKSYKMKNSPREYYDYFYSEYSHSYAIPYSPHIKMTITNRTNQMIFVDLGNSFFVRMGEASPYYVPSVTSNTSGQNTGVGVNLGGVAGALGVGGAVGALARGVTVGKGGSKYTTTTTFSQRIVSIPPMSKKEFEPQLFFIDADKKYPIIGFEHDGGGFDLVPQANFADKRLLDGETLTWEESDSPIKYGNHITYSFSENMESPASLKTEFYLKKAYGSTYRKGLLTASITVPREMICILAIVIR